jgi:hypothetical protein
MFWFAGEKEKVQKGKPNNVFNTETMLPISEIRGDTVILKDGGLRAVVRLTWVNLDLRNYDEQEVIAEQYKRFLNGLDFPIQIMVRNTYLELSDFITYVQSNTTQIKTGSLLRDQADSYVGFLDQINAKQGLVFVKEFYLIVPYYPLEDDISGVRKPRWTKFLQALNRTDSAEKIVSRYRSFLKNNQHLETRVNVSLEGLKWVGIYGERLWLSELIALFFKCYNPDSHKDQAEWVE